MRWPWANWITRLPAQQCRAEVVFLRSDGTPFLDKAMIGRWTDTPEPRVVSVTSANGQVVQLLTNPQELKPTVDVYPGDTELLDVAVRVDGEDDCYGWNDETYYYQNWRNPNRRLGRSIFLVDVIVTSSGKKSIGHFRVANDGPALASFRLIE